MAAPSHIVIATNGPLCRNPRVVKEASALGRNGHAVTVITIRNHAPSEKLDLALLQSAPFSRQTIDLLPGGGPAAFARRLFVRLARDAAFRFGRTSIHAVGPAVPMLRRLRQLPANLTIVHNEITHWAGSRLIADGRRVAADIEDWHSEDLLPTERRGRPLGTLRVTERFLLNRAAYTTTTSHALANALHSRFGGARPFVLTNSFRLQDEWRRAPGDPPAFFWFSQTLGPGRGLEAFLAVWSRTTQPSTVVLLGEPQSGYTESLLHLLPDTHRSRVTFLPLVPPGELPAVIAQHDIGLALEDAAIINRDLTITNKILQYLNAGLAVVATPTTGQREVLTHAPGAGITIDLISIAAGASVLDSLLANRASLAIHQRAARTAAENTYCWEREEPTLHAAVSAALRQTP